MSYSRPGFGATILAVLCAVLTGCSQKQPAPTQRYAFIGFENLSGDPSLDWVARGAGEFLSRSLRDAMSGDGGAKVYVLGPDAIGRAGQALGTHPADAPGISTTRDSALVAGANRIVAGYIERTSGGVRLTASEEDATTHQTLRTLSATAASPFEALTLLARQFSPSAGPPGTTNPEAFRLFCLALSKPAADAPPLLGQAVALDPTFGHAWLLLARTFVVLGDRAHASQIIAQARANKLSPLDTAWLDFEAAALGNDRAVSLAAMRKVSDMEPGDSGLARTLAEAETAAGNFTQAAAIWKRLTAQAPTDVNSWNQLGYTLAWSGDYNGAIAALHEYARLAPNEANPLDSQGDVDFWFGKFADAAASYSAAFAKAPAFLNGGDLYKAAWARQRAGDKKAGDALFAQFRDLREKAKDPNITILTGDWLDRTGRAGEAQAFMRGVLKSSPSSSIACELAVWDLLAGDRTVAQHDISAGGNNGINSAAVLVRFAAMPSATAAEWEARAAKLFAPPQLAGLRAPALGYALILDGKKAAAIPIWEEIVKQSPGSDFFSHAMLTRLKGQPLEHQAPPNPVDLNPFTAVLDSL